MQKTITCTLTIPSYDGPDVIGKACVFSDSITTVKSNPFYQEVITHNAVRIDSFVYVVGYESEVPWNRVYLLPDEDMRYINKILKIINLIDARKTPPTLTERRYLQNALGKYKSFLSLNYSQASFYVDPWLSTVCFKYVNTSIRQL